VVDVARLRLLVKLWRDRAAAARVPPPPGESIADALVSGVIIAANTTVARTCDHCADELERALAEASS
jgi:hypothetical protein